MSAIITLVLIAAISAPSHALPSWSAYLNMPQHKDLLEIMPPLPEEDLPKMPSIPRSAQLPRMPLPIDVNAVISETQTTAPEMPVAPAAPAGTVGRDPNHIMPPLSKRRVEMQSPCGKLCQADEAQWHHTLHFLLGLVSIVTLSLAGGYLVWRYILVPCFEAKPEDAKAPTLDNEDTDEASWSSQVFLDDTQNRDLAPTETHVREEAHVDAATLKKMKSPKWEQKGKPPGDDEFWKGNLSKDDIPTAAGSHTTYQGVSLPEPVEPATGNFGDTGQSDWMDHMPHEGMGSAHTPELLPSPDPDDIPGL